MSKVQFESLAEAKANDPETSFISEFCREFFSIFAQAPKALDGPGRPLFSPNKLRKELFKCHFDDQLFNVGEQADSNECFDRILEKIHVLMNKSGPINNKIELEREAETACDSN